MVGLLVLAALLGGGAFFFLGSSDAGSELGEGEGASDLFAEGDGSGQGGEVDPFADPDDDESKSNSTTSKKNAARSNKANAGTGDPIDPKRKGDANRSTASGANSAGSTESGTEGEAEKPTETEDELPENAGTLTVSVVEAGSGKALAGVEVFAPVPDEPIQLRYGEVLVKPSWQGARKLTNEEGQAIFAPEHFASFKEEKEGRPAITGRARLVVSAHGYVPLDEVFTVSSLGKSPREIQFELVPALRIEGKVSARKGSGGIADAKVEIFRAINDEGKMRSAYSLTTGPSGEFTALVARDYVYKFAVTASGYVKNETANFDFRRDQREVRVLLDKGRSLGGRVYGPDGSVEGALITNETDNISTTSRDDGTFLFTEIGDQIWTNRLVLRVTADGYAPLRVEALANDTEIQIDLQPHAKVTGFVTLDGQGLSGCKVIASQTQGRENYLLPNVSCDEDGLFEITGLGEGQVTLNATGPNGLYSQPVSFSISAGDVKDGVEIKLAKGATLVGVVKATLLTGGEGTLENVPILLDGKEVTRTGYDGSYTIDGISDGEHSVGIPKSDGLPENVQNLQLFSLGERYFTLPAQRSIQAALGQEVRADFIVAEFEAKTEKTINVVLDLDSAESMEDLKLFFTPAVANAPNGAPAETIERNVDLVAGKYEFELILLKGVSYSGAVTHVRIHDKQISAQEIDAVQDGGLLQIKLEAAYVVTGYIKDSSDNPLPNASVGLEGSNQQGVRTDQHGYFEFGGLKVGTYTLVAFRQSYYEYRQEVKVEQPVSDPITIVLLGANEIRIHVFEPSGAPARNARVRIWRPSTDDPTSSLQLFNLGETDAKGDKIVNFHWIRHYQIVADKNGAIAFVNFPNETAVNVREFDLHLESGAEVSGTVLNAQSNAPIAGVDIYLRLEGQGSPRDGNRFYAETNSKGEFKVRVPVGTFTMVVRESRAYQLSETSGVNSGTSGSIFYAEPKDDVNGNWAERVSITAPSRVTAGQTFSVTVTFRNRGSTTWTEGAKYRAGSESKRDNKTWGNSRLRLAGGMSVAPGSVGDFTMEVRAPTSAGNHTMTWRMVQDGKEWFGEFSETLTIVVDPAPTE